MSTLIPKYSPITTSNRTIAEKLGDFVSVKDFGAVGDGVTDDTVAIQTAFASGITSLYFPSGTYLLNAAITSNTVSNIYGDGNQSTIKCRNDLSNITFFTLASGVKVSELAIIGYNKTAGIGISVSGGSGIFVAHVTLENCVINNFLTGISVDSVFDLKITDCRIYTCGVGLEMSPAHLTNGYINAAYVDKCYFWNHATYNVHASPAVRISNLSFINCVFDPGASIASVYLNIANPVLFDNCYFETTATDAVYCSLATATFNSCYFVGSDPVTCAANNNFLNFNSCRSLVVYANNVLNNVQINNTNGATVTSATGTPLNYINSTVNGTYYASKFTTTALGTGDKISDFAGFTKSITQTINANTSAAIITDQLLDSDKRWGSGVIGVASFSDLYSPGLLLTVTCATTASNAYFSVIATNTTASNIVITAKTLNVIIQRMSTYTSL